MSILRCGKWRHTELMIELILAAFVGIFLFSAWVTMPVRAANRWNYEGAPTWLTVCMRIAGFAAVVAAHVQWKSLGDLARGYAEASFVSVVLSLAILILVVPVSHVLMVLCALRGHRLAMARDGLPMWGALMYATAILGGGFWLMSMAPQVNYHPSGQLAQLALILVTLVVGLAVGLTLFSMMTMGVFFMIKDAFRAVDVHPRLAPVSSIMLGAVTGGIAIYGLVRGGLDPALPPIVAVAMAIGGPCAAIGLGVWELLPSTELGAPGFRESASRTFRG